MDHPELLSPAGSWECARAAIANGADAIYFGLPRFNARLRADNFTEEQLPELVEFCHSHGVRAYVALNTLVFTGELKEAEAYLRLLNGAGVDALIVQDVGLVHLARQIVPELEIHASTQMTITSPEGLHFARELGVERVVLARELSLRELKKFGAESSGTPILPLEVFVHGALCVAYSGQCLTSESLGQRSANRGECAQACRMPYQLIVDGIPRDLGDKSYLLSPQDLAAVDQIPDLLAAGVTSFKIEGRLKNPEYVAAVTQVYRKAIDAALEGKTYQASPTDWYQLEMTFSRGFFTGWLNGVNHQRLVHAEFGKKRGPLAGTVERCGADYVEFSPHVPLKPGDGLVFENAGDTNQEQGGRIYELRGNRFRFKHGHIDFQQLRPGTRIWKTDDPELESRLRQSFTGNIPTRRTSPVRLRVEGAVGTTLTLHAEADSRRATAVSTLPLQAARTAPLTTESLTHHLSRMGGTRFHLETLENQLEGEVILPAAEINRLRREVLFELQKGAAKPESGVTVENLLRAIPSPSGSPTSPELAVLCRTHEQVETAARMGVARIYADFEDIRRYRASVESVRTVGGSRIYLATPRIQKAGESGFFKLIETAEPDGVLVRNLGGLEHFKETALDRIGDFSLNVANPLSASLLKSRGLSRLTISYDLNIDQILALLASAPPEWFELTIHQHMPMFHMEHCVFAAFLSEGTDHTNCGRPCESHRVHLRDRVGMEHPLRADVGCRNTLFNAIAQTGAVYFNDLYSAGLRNFRVELMEEPAANAARTIEAYQALLRGDRGEQDLWKELHAASQLGVTRGTYSAR